MVGSCILKNVFLGLLTLLSTYGVCQRTSQEYESSAAYVAGFKTAKLDFNGNTIQGSRNLNSIIEVDIWYPARSSRKNRALRYAYFLRQHEIRLARYNTNKSWKGVTTENEKYYLPWNVNNQSADPARLETLSFKDAPEAGDSFPLIIYFTSNLNAGFENIKLFEFLASHGFVIAAISPDDFRKGTKEESNVIAEINNADLILNYLKGRPLVDSTKVAAMGWREGGMTAVLSATLLPEIKSLVSIEGAEVHYYHENNRSKFESLLASSTFQSENIQVPYLYLDGEHQQHYLLKVDSVYNPISKISGSGFYIRNTDLLTNQISPVLSDYLSAIERLDKRNFHDWQNRLIMNFLSNTFANQVASFGYQLEADILNGQENLQLFMPQTTYDDYEIRGKVVDEKSNEAIAYPDIIIQPYELGDIGMSDGSFKLNYLDQHIDGKIIVSAPGYMTKQLNLSETQEREEDFVIIGLKPDGLTDLIDENSSLVKSKFKTEGESTKFHDVLFENTQLGVLFKKPEQPYYIEGISFVLTQNSTEKMVVRPRVYTLKNGMPDEEITPHNLTFDIDSNLLPYEIEFDNFNLKVEDEIFVCLELVEVIGDSSNVGLKSLLSDKFIYYKSYWETDWRRNQGLVPEITLTVNYERNEE